MNYGFRKQVKKSWRKPRGVDNKKRIRKAFAGASPKIGYGNSRAVKYNHPTGTREALVRNLHDLQDAINKSVSIRIASNVGGKKRALMLNMAKEFKLKVLNA